MQIWNTELVKKNLPNVRVTWIFGIYGREMEGVMDSCTTDGSEEIAIVHPLVHGKIDYSTTWKWNLKVVVNCLNLGVALVAVHQ